MFETLSVAVLDFIFLTRWQSSAMQTSSALQKMFLSFWALWSFFMIPEYLSASWLCLFNYCLSIEDECSWLSTSCGHYCSGIRGQAPTSTADGRPRLLVSTLHPELHLLCIFLLFAYILIDGYKLDFEKFGPILCKVIAHSLHKYDR